MTLPERLKLLGERAQAATELDRARNHARIIHERASQLGREAKLFQSDYARARVLIENGIAVSHPPPPLLVLQKYRDATTDNPAGGGREFQLLVKELAKTLKSLRQAVSKGIQAAREPLIEQNTRASALKSLAKVEGYEERAGQVLLMLGNLVAEDWAKKEPEDLGELLRLRAEVLSEIDELQTQDVSDELRAFFKVVREEGATLDQWTEEVQKYLADRGLRDRIRIVLR